MTDQQWQVAGALIALGMALPFAWLWVWLICRDHERLQEMRTRHPPPNP